MKRYIYTVGILVLLLCGCATIPRYWEVGREGYISPEGITARAGIEAVTRPFVGEPWSTILGSLAGLLAGGYAVYKRKQWLEVPPK